MEVLWILLHDYNILGNCLADVVLPLTGTVVKDFTVMRTSTGVVHVYMPSCMKTNWTCYNSNLADSYCFKKKLCKFRGRQ